MFSLVLGTPGIHDLREAFERAGEKRGYMAQGIAAQAAQVARGAMERRVRDRDLLWRGTLLNSFDTAVLTFGTDASAAVIGKAFSTANKEAVVADLGRRAGDRMPGRKIAAWIIDHLDEFKILGNIFTKSGKVKASQRKYADQKDRANEIERRIKQMTYLIGKDIAKEGREGIDFVEAGGEAMDYALPDITDKAHDRWLSDSFEAES